MLGHPTIWITVGQRPTALAVGAGGGCLDIFTLIYPFCHLSLSLWETARYRLKYCLKGPLNPKTTNQPTLESILMSYLMFDHKLNGVLGDLSAIGSTVHILQNTLDNILIH